MLVPFLRPAYGRIVDLRLIDTFFFGPLRKFRLLTGGQSLGLRHPVIPTDPTLETFEVLVDP
jgi:hypothetical protein